MTKITWASESRGAEVRPPALRLYVSRVVAVPKAQEDAPAAWLPEKHAKFWKPVRLVWGVNGRPSTLTLRRLLGVGSGTSTRTRAEDSELIAGDRVRLVEAGGGSGDGTVRQEWFRGYVAQERIAVQSGPDEETCEVVAYGPEILLRGKSVSGQWHAVRDVDEHVIQGTFSPEMLCRQNTFRSHLPVVFNDAGRPNASPAGGGQTDSRWHLDSNAEAATAEGRTLDAPGRSISADGRTYQAELWRAKSAVQSLVETVDDYEVVSPQSMAGLPAALSDRVLDEVNVEGRDLLEALRAVLLPVGFGFCLEPWADRTGRHVLRVFPLHGSVDAGNVRKPFMAPIDGPVPSITDPAAQRAQVQRIEFIRDNHNVRNDVTVIGDQKRQQVVLVFASTGSDLQPAWDSAVHDLANWASDGVVDPMRWPIEGRSVETIEQFDELYTYGVEVNTSFRHVFRSFVWNEDGAFNEVANEMPDPADRSAGCGQHCVRRPRPVRGSFLRDDGNAKVRNLPAVVQLGIEGDDEAWIQIPAVVWTDRAGFTIPINPLWQWHPYGGPYARHAAGSGQTLFEKYGRYNYLGLLHNALRGSGTRLTLRLIGSIESDEAITGRAPRRVESSWPLVASHVIRAENRFRYRGVPGESDPFDLAPGRHDTRDDSDDAASYAASVRETLEDEVGHGSIVLRHLTRAYAPGDVVPSTQGRVIDLTVRGGAGGHAPVVVGVSWDFDLDVNKTELVLDTSVLKVTQ